MLRHILKTVPKMFMIPNEAQFWVPCGAEVCVIGNAHSCRGMGVAITVQRCSHTQKRRRLESDEGTESNVFLAILVFRGG